MNADCELILEGKSWRLNTIEGTEGEKALDIAKLRSETGYITLDPGYQNTGACQSAITFINGEEGILRYRGYPVEELGQRSSFLETAHLLIYGELPTAKQLDAFSGLVEANSLIHESMRSLFKALPAEAPPMAVLSSMINLLSVYHPNFFVDDGNPETFELITAKLLSTVRTIAAFAYKKSVGEPLVYPAKDLSYCANFLNMMFSKPNAPYTLEKETEQALEMLLILHADHEQNCSTSAVRLVGSSRVNLYSSICAGICALWGPLHGGANQRVIEMLEKIQNDNIPIREYIEKVKQKDSSVRLMGFGHRVYKNFDPRAKIIKDMCKKMLKKRGATDPLFELALELEEAALRDAYFLEKKLYPNVDFYSGLIYRAIGIPSNMFTVMFVMGRMPGWIAQWKELHNSVPFKIGRPRQIYIGEKERKYVPLSKRKAPDHPR